MLLLTRAGLIGLIWLLASSAFAYDLTTVDQLRPYEPATLQGTVQRVTESDTFVFEDATGSVQIYIGPHRMPVGAGDSVTVNGRLDDGWPREVYADELVLSDGQVIEVGGPYE